MFMSEVVVVVSVGFDEKVKGHFVERVQVISARFVRVVSEKNVVEFLLVNGDIRAEDAEHTENLIRSDHTLPLVC